MIETWVLMFYLTSGAAFDGGEYQTLERCRAGMVRQLNHWRAHYHDPHIKWKCSLAPRAIDDLTTVIIEGEKP